MRVLTHTACLLTLFVFGFLGCESASQRNDFDDAGAAESASQRNDISLINYS